MFVPLTSRDQLVAAITKRNSSTHVFLKQFPPGVVSCRKADGQLLFQLQAESLGGARYGCESFANAPSFSVEFPSMQVKINNVVIEDVELKVSM